MLWNTRFSWIRFVTFLTWHSLLFFTWGWIYRLSSLTRILMKSWWRRMKLFFFQRLGRYTLLIKLQLFISCAGFLILRVFSGFQTWICNLISWNYLLVSSSNLIFRCFIGISSTWNCFSSFLCVEASTSSFWQN